MEPEKSEGTGTAPSTNGHRRTTRKKDKAPRGVFQPRKGMWAIRFTCGAGHIHKEHVGQVKGDAVTAHHRRRDRARSEPGWCPVTERRRVREQVEAERHRERARITFATYAKEHYLPHAKLHKRSWRTDASRIAWLVTRFGSKRLDELSAQDIDALMADLRKTKEPGTVNRYRDLCSAIFKRAVRDGYVATNPVRAVAKLREPAGRVAWMGPEEEEAVENALPSAFRPHFLFSIHTGLRYGEQMGLRWRDVDMMTGLVTIPRSKNGHSRQVEMNSVVRSVVMDLAAKRKRTDDPGEYVFDPRPVQSKSFFNAAVERAEQALRQAGKDAARLEGYVWHCNRHTFASRLVMAGVDLRTVQELGGWRSLAMVQKYAHLAPAHRLAAVEALVRAPELARNLPEAPQPRQPVLGK